MLIGRRGISFRGFGDPLVIVSDRTGYEAGMAAAAAAAAAKAKADAQSAAAFAAVTQAQVDANNPFIQYAALSAAGAVQAQVDAAVASGMRGTPANVVRAAAQAPPPSGDTALPATAFPNQVGPAFTQQPDLSQPELVPASPNRMWLELGIAGALGLGVILFLRGR